MPNYYSKRKQSSPLFYIISIVTIAIVITGAFFFNVSKQKIYIKDYSGNVLGLDGIDGPRTQSVRKQIALKNTLGFLSVTMSKGEVVKWVQTRCNEILGINLEITGVYTNETKKAVIQVQKKLNLETDGVVGYNTIQALFYN